MDWTQVRADEAGLSAPALQDAVAFAQAHETDWPRSMIMPDGRYVAFHHIGDRPPYDQVLGPIKERGTCAGVILRRGRLVAAWGDVERTDMTFSVAKSYLGAVAGLAVQDGLIGSVDDPVSATVDAAEFESAHNRQITWRHLLQLTSEWQGTLWDRPDSADHNRQVGAGSDNARKGEARAVGRPGTHFEYNDVRVNLLAYALMLRFGRELPEVLRERIMDPIGGSADWAWRGYRNSTVTLGGRAVESVSGGGHWGGGMFISARDHALFGRLIQLGGRWGERQLLPAAWIRTMLTPSANNALYGCMWWLNTERKLYPAASAGSAFAAGAGQHLIWVDDAHELVMAARWIDKAHCNELIARVLASVVA